MDSISHFESEFNAADFDEKDGVYDLKTRILLSELTKFLSSIVCVDNDLTNQNKPVSHRIYLLWLNHIAREKENTTDVMNINGSNHSKLKTQQPRISKAIEMLLFFPLLFLDVVSSSELPLSAVNSYLS